MSKVSVSKIKSFTGHRDCIYTMEKSAFSSQIYSAGGDGFVAIWDLKKVDEGSLLVQLPRSVYALHFLEDQNLLIVGQNFEGIHVIDLASKKEVGSLKLGNSAIFDITSSGANLIVALGSGELIIVSIKELQILDRIKLSEKSIRSIAIHETAGMVVTGDSENKVKLLNLKDLKLIRSLSDHKNSVFTIKFSPDYRYLLTGSRDAHLQVRDVDRDFKISHDIVAHMFAINNIDFSPDGKYFVTCSMDKSIKIWDSNTFRLLKVIDKSRHAGHGTSVNRVMWTNFENQLLSASDDKSISVWDIKIND